MASFFADMVSPFKGFPGHLLDRPIPVSALPLLMNYAFSAKRAESMITGMLYFCGDIIHSLEIGNRHRLTTTRVTCYCADDVWNVLRTGFKDFTLLFLKVKVAFEISPHSQMLRRCKRSLLRNRQSGYDLWWYQRSSWKTPPFWNGHHISLFHTF
eukprot:GHVN01068871.1.p1 GENE.GHVN01068871.1~~GHVN01068871.1.p1  ORF type:complete len:155 (+),score=2.11 GHVN01068871.1:922-1386(+)